MEILYDFLQTLPDINFLKMGKVNQFLDKSTFLLGADHC